MPEDSTEEDDPFKKLDEAARDRQGDPFENLSSGERDETEPTPGTDSSDRTPNELESKPTQDHFEGESEPNRDTFDQFSGVEEDAQPPESESAESQQTADQQRDEPAEESTMQFGIARRESEEPDDMPPLSDLSGREGNPFEGVDDAFESVDVEQVDPDLVWQELTSAESRGSVGEAQKRTYAEVSKHSYCEQCEHFSEPPDVHCTHEGTEIVEFLDMETVRLVDCPIVTAREKLEDDGHGKD